MTRGSFFKSMAGVFGLLAVPSGEQKAEPVKEKNGRIKEKFKRWVGKGCDLDKIIQHGIDDVNGKGPFIVWGYERETRKTWGDMYWPPEEIEITIEIKRIKGG